MLMKEAFVMTEEFHVFSGEGMYVHSTHKRKKDAFAAVKKGQQVGKLAPKLQDQQPDEFQGYTRVWNHDGKQSIMKDDDFKRHGWGKKR